METFSRPPAAAAAGTAPTPKRPGGTARAAAPASDSELFFGYYLSAATMMRRGTRPARPRAGPPDDPDVLPPRPGPRPGPGADARCPPHGIPLGDILADSGYAHRDADAWAIPLRAAGASSIQDLHPDDRGPQGTHHGAIIANGNLYCPATPRPLLELGPLARDATPDQTAAHDQQTAETARYKLGKITATTPTATTGSCAPPPWARSAARSARHR